SPESAGSLGSEGETMEHHLSHRVQRSQQRGILLVMAVALLAGWGVRIAPPARAAFRGKNGKIAWDHEGELHTINPDGSADTKLTGGTEPNCSPDGTKIVFNGGPNGISVINADGTGEKALTNNANPAEPSWSPDGT